MPLRGLRRNLTSHVLLLVFLFLVRLLRCGTQQEIEDDNEAAKKDHTPEEHEEQPPYMHVLPIGIGWLQKDE